MDSIIAVRIYRDKKNYKITRAKLVNIENLEVREFTAYELKNILRSSGLKILNIELNDKGNIVLRDTNPNSKKTYFSKVEMTKEYAYRYCFITNYNQDSSVGYVADYKHQQVLSNRGCTLGEISGTLGMAGVEYLTLANAIVRKDKDNNLVLFVYNNDNNCYHKLPVEFRGEMIGLFSDDMEYSVIKTDQHGVYLKYLANEEGIESFVIPQGVCYLEKFGGGINKLVVPDSLREFGDECFEEVDDLFSIQLGKGLTEIPDSCFCGSFLITIKFGENIKKIKPMAFYECFDLSGTIDTKATVIEEDAFVRCRIDTLNLPCIKAIGRNAFKGCRHLEEVNLGEDLKYIGVDAFEGCLRLKEIKIPKNCIRIRSRAFRNCVSLKTAYISRNTILGEKVFPRKTNIIYY